MISAKDAREMTKAIEELLNEREFAKIEGLIYYAITNGKSEISYDILSDSTTKKLEELGYNVKIESETMDEDENEDYVDPYTTISW